MRPRRLLVVVVALAVGAAACGPTSVVPGLPTASPTAVAATARPSSPGPAASPSDAWADAAVALPLEVTLGPSLEPGFFCDPCHNLEEDQFLGVAAVGGQFVAVGVQQPPARAVAFSSTDGSNWTPVAGFDSVSGALNSTAIAVASIGQQIVVVGSNHDGATGWATTGAAWTVAPPQASLSVAYAAGAMTAVAAFGATFVAGGYRDDPLHGTASAAVWRSADGLTWTPDDGAGTFAGGRILGIVAAGETIVAVGTAGDPNYGPAAVWRWTESTGWQRASFASGDAGAMRAVTATAQGFVAVGLDGHDAGAMAWTSPDGLTWTAASDQPAFHHGTLPVRMQSVADGPAGLIAGGWRSDVGKGSAVTWTSRDGVTWQGPTWQSSFSGCQVTGVAIGGNVAVAVGRLGYPDQNQAAAWRQPVP
jgi:hypothetical protein